MEAIDNEISSHKPEDFEADVRVRDIKERLFGKTITAFTIIGCFALVISVFRNKELGLQSLSLGQAVALISIFSLGYLKTRLSLTVRLSILIALQMVLGIVGLIGYSLLAFGWGFFILAAILASSFSTQRYALVVFASGALSSLVVAILYQTGIAEIKFDAMEYLNSAYAWAMLLTAFLMITGIAVIINSSLIRNVMQLVYESENRLNQIKLLNESLEQKVIERTAQLNESNHQKDKVMGMLAHDVRNRLGGVTGALELLDAIDKSANDLERTELMDMASESAKVALKILSEALEYAKLSDGNRVINTEKIDIYTFVESAIYCHKPNSMKKGVSLSIGARQGEFQCEINAVSISRVIDNLITNAIKFTKPGGFVLVDIEKMGKDVLITVKDNGIGIPENLLSKIFDPFSKAGRAGTDGENSTGLGLSIAKKIIEEHSGKIWVETQEGKGSKFILSLPIVDK